jgi:transcriptional regulator GlxA family with amidase domain
MTTSPRTVGILIFNEVEVLDFCGPFEVFSIVRSTKETTGDQPLFTALIIAERAGVVRCRGGLLVQPHHTIVDHPPLDILVIPGGQGTRREQTNQSLLDWIAAQDRQTSLTTSVCTGAFLLAANGLLDGRRATTHWASIDRLRELRPAIDVRSDQRVVDEGRIITSAGVSAGIDMALAIVARLHGLETAEATARQMEYDALPGGLLTAFSPKTGPPAGPVR